MALELRRGTENDIEPCLMIAKQLPQYFTNKALTAMNNDLKNNELVIAEISNEVVGFISYLKKNQNTAELSWLAVAPNHQRKGIGSELVKYIITELKSGGFNALEVKTLAKVANYPPYHGTRRFYEAVGFMHRETIDQYPGWDPGNPCAKYVMDL